MTEEIATCGPDQTLNDAAQIMWERDCGFVPIIENDGTRRLVGVVTDRDICMGAYTHGQALSQIRIGDVMSRNVRTCKPADDIASAESVLRGGQIHRLPVVDHDNDLLGVISLADIARHAARESGSSRQATAAAEIGHTVAAIRQPRATA
jgi:CBS domain-containing protein